MFPPGFDPNKLRGMQNVNVPQRPPTIRMQLEMQVKRGEQAKKMLETLNANPKIEDFLDVLQNQG